MCWISECNFLSATLLQMLYETMTWFQSKDSSSDIIYFLVKIENKFIQPILLDDSPILKTIFWEAPALVFIHIKLSPVPCQDIEVLSHRQVTLLQVMKYVFYGKEF